jgi:hypothetical protein
MTITRRNFLKLLGLGAVAPLVPKVEEAELPEPEVELGKTFANGEIFSFGGVFTSHDGESIVTWNSENWEGATAINVDKDGTIYIGGSFTALRMGSHRNRTY